jgi:hypothetical protein
MYIISLDVGQRTDFSALVVVEPVGGAAPDGSAEWTYHVRHLERLELRTPYPAVVSRVVSLLETPPLAHEETFLLVDQTGIGQAIYDWLTVAGVQPIGITIHGGDAVGRDGLYRLRVPKKELASRLTGLFQAGRIHIAADLDLAPVLIREMRQFRPRVHSNTGYTGFEAAEGHDDLIVSLALATWWGETELAKHRPVDEETAQVLWAVMSGEWQPWAAGPTRLDRRDRRRA